MGKLASSNEQEIVDLEGKLDKEIHEKYWDILLCWREIWLACREMNIFCLACKTCSFLKDTWRQQVLPFEACECDSTHHTSMVLRSAIFSTPKSGKTIHNSRYKMHTYMYTSTLNVLSSASVCSTTCISKRQGLDEKQPCSQKLRACETGAILNAKTFLVYLTK